ncbi:hypothetical protein [Streptomyces violascens]|uniref:FXSXX-COOH protein n=1 Tax=Streptomyces violascens TaxID=67381 RepID=A0ABQ3QSH8_9ACTN|nr:hypothetical protein [Streptomyces violascens]GGU33148.1 hypothetical protein GCM10010289_62990 [Streptomyces violascens]GHI40240.1 hypothetical protein Sviol_46480 [Streptomyces violascens]
MEAPRTQPFDDRKRRPTVTGSDHISFTDLPVLASQLNVPTPGATISGEREAEITALTSRLSSTST